METKRIYSPGHLYHDGIGIWIDEIIPERKNEMNKPSNWYNMDYAERSEWEKQESAREDLEYQARQAQNDAEQARYDAQQQIQRAQRNAAGQVEEMSYELENAFTRIATQADEIERLKLMIEKLAGMISQGEYYGIRRVHAVEGAALVDATIKEAKEMASQ